MTIPTKDQQDINLRAAISNRFSAWLNHNQITLGGVSRKSGLSVGGLSLVRAGKRLPSALTLYGIAQAGMDVHWLVTGEIKQR